MVYLTNTGILLCAIIEAGDWLYRLRKTDNHGEEDLIDLGDDAGAGERNFFAVYRHGAVMRQRLVQGDLYDGHGNLIEALRGAQRGNAAHAIFARMQMLAGDSDCLIVHEIAHRQCSGDNLSYNGRQCGTCHAPMKTKDKNRV